MNDEYARAVKGLDVEHEPEEGDWFANENADSGITFTLSTPPAGAWWVPTLTQLLDIVSNLGYSDVWFRHETDADSDWATYSQIPIETRYEDTRTGKYLHSETWLCTANREDDSDLEFEIRTIGSSREAALYAVCVRLMDEAADVAA